MSPTTKQLREKNKATKNAPERKRKPAAGSETPSEGPAEVTVDGITLANRAPYFLPESSAKLAWAEATIALLAETAALKGEDYEPAYAPTTWSKKHTPEQLREQHAQALDGLVQVRLTIKAADEAEAAAVAQAEPAPEPKATRQRTPRAADTRMPAVGTVLRKTKGETVLEATVTAEGVLFDGATYRSLSAAAVAAAAKLGLCSKAQNGFAFWGLLPKGERKPRAAKAPTPGDLQALEERLAKAKEKVAQLEQQLKDAKAVVDAVGYAAGSEPKPETVVLPALGLTVCAACGGELPAADSGLAHLCTVNAEMAAQGGAQ